MFPQASLWAGAIAGASRVGVLWNLLSSRKRKTRAAPWRWVGRCVFLGLFLASAGVGRTAPGEVDLAFHPPFIESVVCTAVQADGKILVGGASYTVDGVTHPSLVRLTADGALEMAFSPQIVLVVDQSSVSCVVVQTDGRMVIGGVFDRVNGAVRNNLARLYPDGTLDADYDPHVNGQPSTFAMQPDGKMIVAGSFTTIGNVERESLARLNADGTVDLTFNPQLTGYTNCMAMQADGKVVIGGYFGSQGDGDSPDLVRLNADGTVDGTFTPPHPDGGIYCLAMQADGKILIGGGFSQVAGGPRSCLARLNSDGTLDPGLNSPELVGLDAPPYISSLVLQADGKFLIAGPFQTLGNVQRSTCARLNSDGTVDPSFGGISYASSLTMQSDGKVVAAGYFPDRDGAGRYLLRLENDAATQSLAVASPGVVRWMRGGSAPEVGQVMLEVFDAVASAYVPLGFGTHIAGGWEWTGLSLSAHGELRARGRINRGSSLIQSMVALGTVAPEIVVEQPPGSGIADGGSRSFGDVSVGDSRDVSFTIRNTGTASLTGLGITVDGPDQAVFTVIATPSAPVPPGGGTTTFTVRFTSTATGVKSATLHLASNDSDESPFDLLVTANGTLSTNADLAALRLSSGMLKPTFARGTPDYTASVAFKTNVVTVTLTVAQSTATVTVNGVVAAAGVPVKLSVGSNVISIVVTAGNGVTTRPYTVTVTREAPIPGELDVDFNPSFLPPPPLGSSNYVVTAVEQADGKVLVGSYSGSDGTDRRILVRLNPDGTLDPDFNPTILGSSVYVIAVQMNGDVLVGGSFYSVNGVARNNLARLHADGTLDPAFAPNVSGSIQSMIVQPDGRVVIAGYPSSTGMLRNGIARLNADGMQDSAFDPACDGFVASTARQPDGKIVIAGGFTHVSGLARNRIARLNADGTVDLSFDPNASNSVYSAAVQADGKIVIAGFFTGVGGVTRNNLARIEANGTLDLGFNPSASGFVTSTVFQADAKIIVGGGFTSVGSVGRNRIARLNPDGTLDLGFNPDADGFVYSLALQADGRVLAVGSFTKVGGVARNSIARLENDPASHALSVPDATRVQWLRGGAAPEIESTVIELSNDAGNSFLPLPSTRIAGGWEAAGLSLPASGEIRARGRTDGGYYNGSSGVVEARVAFGPVAPVIAVEQPSGQTLATGSPWDFGDVPAGDDRSVTFTLRNTGTATLTGLSMSTNGADQAMFIIAAKPTLPVPGNGGTTTLIIRFVPTSAGLKSAAIHLTGNDPNQSTFDLILTGNGTLSTNADLATLSLSGGTLEPPFSSSTTAYTVALAHNLGNLSLTPTVAQSTATVTINGSAVASGRPSAPLTLAVGANVITILVTAGDGVTRKSYTLTVTLAPAVAGDLDLSFYPDLTPFNLSFSNPVHSLAVQPDHKILVGTGAGLFRLNDDGTPDPGFPPYWSGAVYSVAVQTDGRILIAGGFGVTRLYPDGRVDPSFGPYLDGTPFCLVLQPDGKIVVGGVGQYGGGPYQTTPLFARFNTDGSVDTGFSKVAVGFEVLSMALGEDGKLVVGGYFGIEDYGDFYAYAQLVRVNRDGTRDAFGADIFHGDGGPYSYLYCTAYQADGKLLFGGIFGYVNGAPRRGLARLNSNGSLDTAFNPNVDQNGVSSIAVQADGKILIGGGFTTVNGVARRCIARLNPDGTLDMNFDPNMPGNTVSMAIQNDGRILVGSDFGIVGGVSGKFVARLENGLATQSFDSPSANRLRWLRGGTSPEVRETAFEFSTDGGKSFSTLGTGSRISGGWECAGVSLPVRGILRGRGRTVGGERGTSSGLVEVLGSYDSDVDHDGLYDAWELTYWPTTAGHSANDDFDHDGLTELQELAFGLDPRVADRFLQPTPVLEAGYLTITLTKFPGVNYEVQSAGTLLPSQPDSFRAVTTTVLVNNATTLKVRDNFPAANALSRFMRVVVAAAP